ncbi:MAG TPA: PKD domain-containing protein [Fulvivirga sp.]|nr:PKD domain-containing protein [Fulvivirga sp.]
MIKYTHWLFLLSLLAVSNVAFGQLNATQARHETLNQDQVVVTLDGNLGALYNCTGGCLTNWTLTIGAAVTPITSLIGASGSNQVVISFASPIGIGDVVRIDHTNDGIIGNINNLISQNNWLRACDDFNWVGNNVPSDVCAPVSPKTRMSFSVTRRLRNSSNWDITRITSIISWGDGGSSTSFLSAYESDPSGNPGVNTYFISYDADLSGFSYPGNEVVCGYSSTWRVRLNNAPAINCPPTDANQSVVYSSYNTDAAGEGDGGLALQPTVANSDLVCEGEFVNMSFDDVSNLNCIDLAAAPAPFTLNSRDRHVRVIYGFPNDPGNTIRNVEVLGTQITDANGNLLIPGGFIPTTPNALGNPDPFGVVNFPAAVTGPAGTLETITTSTATLVGDANRTFNITIEYWNYCNAYDGAGNAINNNERSITDQVIVVQAPLSSSPVDREVCYNSTIPTFRTTGNAANATVNWYRDNAGVIGAFLTSNSANGAGQANLTATTGGVVPNNTTPGDYFVWSSYIAPSGGINCESPPVRTQVTIRNQLTTGMFSPMTGDTEVCNGTNDVPFDVANPAPIQTFGGTTEYLWTTSGGGGVSIDAPNTAQNVTVDFNIGTEPNPFDQRNIRARLRYSNNDYLGDNCQTGNLSTTVDIYGTSSGGSISPATQTICAGDVITDILISSTVPLPFRGTIRGWERSVNGGAFVADGSLGVGNPITPLVPIVAGVQTNYRYRAIVQNGSICSSVLSPVATIIVNPIPPKPTITPSGATTLCFGGNVTLSSSNTLANSYRWYKDGVFTGVTTQTIMLSSVAQSGDYTVETLGANPTNCVSPLSDPETIIIDPLPTATMSGGGSVCGGVPGPASVITMTGTGPFNVTYERNGNPTTVNGISSPYTIPGSTVVTDDPDTYIVTSITDLGTTINCTVNAPSANITGSSTIATSGTPPPTIDSYTIGGAICNDGAGTALPSIALDLNPNSVENYDIDFEVYESAAPPPLGPAVLTRTINKTTNAAGALTFSAADLDYADLLNTPDTYTVRLTSIINTLTGCNAAGLPADQDIIINPRPADPTNPIGAVACSSDPTGATISVDDPGAGFVVRWYTAYTDETTNTPALGVTGGVGAGAEFEFTPTSNATQTYLTVVESNTNPTNCHSVNSLAVQHTQDLLPTAADADLDDDASLLETCTDALVLGATPADNGGTGTWTYPGLLFYEDFNGFADGTYQSLGTFGWTRDISATSFDGSDHFEVRSNAFEGNDLDGEAIWTSATINVSAIANFTLSIDAFEVGDHEPADYIELTYQIDANPEQTVGTVTGNFTSSPISGTFATGGGTNLVIRVKMLNNSTTEFLSFDNVSLVDAAATALTFSDIHDENATVSGLPVATTALTWSVASALGSCTPTTDVVNVIRNPLPVANDITPELCEDLPQGSDVVVGVDLTIAAYSDAITGIPGSTNRTIEYFDDAARMPIDAIPDPTNVDISNTEVVYIRVTDTGTSLNTSCTQDATITFTVHTLPDAIDQDASNNAAETEFCEETVASLNTKDDIDLTTLDDNVSNGAANRSVEWFVDPGPVPTTRADLTGFEVPNDLDVDGVSDGDIFYAIVVNTLTSCEDIASVTFTINPRPEDNAIIAPDGTTPASVSLCKSNNVLFFQVDETQTPGSTYNWTIPTGVGELVLVGGGGANDFFVLLRAPNTIIAPGVTLSVQETSSDGCPGNVNSINIIVDDAPPAPVITGDQDVCTNEQNVVYSITTPVVSSTYTWSIGSLGSIVSGQGTSSIIVNIGVTSASITVTELNATGCISPAAAPYPVTVHARPTMTSPTTLELCSGEQVNDGTAGANLILTSSIGGSIFSWVVNSKTGSVGGAAVGNSGPGQIPHTLTNTSGAPGSVTYEITATSPAPGLCVGPTQVVTITVDPEPVGANITRAVECSNVAFSVSPDNITNGLGGTSTYTWVRNALPAGLTQITAGTGSGMIAETLQNLTSATLNAVYVVTPESSDNCFGTPYNVTIPIGPQPVGAAITRANQCSDVAFSVSADNITNGIGGTSTYTWVRNALPAGLTEVTAGTGTGAIAETLQNLTNATINATYVVTPKSANGCDGNSYVITVPIDGEPVGADITRAAACSDVAFSVSADNITNSVASTFTWVRNALPAGLTQVTAGTGTGAIAETLQNLTGGTLNATYVVTPQSGDGCDGATYVVTVPVNPEPVGADITRADACSDVAFSVSPDNISNGVAATFTWVRNALPAGLTQVTAGTGTGAIAETLQNLTGGTLNATYVVTAQSGDGCNSNTYVVTVPVNPEPVGADITRADACSNVAFSVSADNISNGVAATFTWVRNALPAGLTEITAGTGTGAIAETLQNLTGGTLNATYVVTAQSGDGCDGNTYVVTVPVNPEPVGADITRAAACSDVVFSVSADNISNGLGGTSTYTWVRNALPAGLTQIAVGTGTGAIAETLQNLTGGTLNATYVVTPQSADGCDGNTYVVTVPVNPEPVGADVTRAAACSDVAFSVSADNISNGLGGTSTYSWVRNALPAGLTQVTAGTGTGAIAETLQNLTGGTLNATYVVTPQSADGCDGNTYVVTVPVNPEPVGADITRADACSDVAFSVSSDNISNGVASTFTWVRNPLPAGLTQVTAGTGTGAIAETLQNLTGSTLNATYVVTAQSGNGCNSDTYVVTVPVNPEPVGADITRADACSDVAFSVSSDNISNGVTATFTWVRNALPAGLTQVAAGTGTGAIAETLQNLTGGTLNATYVVTAQSGDGCNSDTYVVTVPVNPEPVGADITRAAACSDVAFSVSADNISNGLGGTSTYTWVRNALPAGLTQVTAGTGTGAIAETLQNLSGGTLNATYVVTPQSADGCIGNTYVVTVPVNPEPVGANITRADACSDMAFSVSADNISNGLGGTSTYSWVRNALPAGLTQVTAGTGTGAIAETLQNLTGGTLNATYVVTPQSADGCDGDPYVITVPVNPEPVGADVTRADACSDVAFSVSADNISNGLGGTSTYTWVRNALPAGLTQVTAGTGTGAIAETLQNLTSGTLNATYVVTPQSADGCDGNTYVVTVPVDPEPVGADITRADACSDVAFSVSPDNISNGVAATFTWVRNPLPAGLTQVTAGTGTGAIAETLQNLTGGTLNATYVVTAQSGDGCNSDTYVVTVPVNPEPVGADITRADACSDVAFSVSPDNISNGLGGTSTYTWVRNALPAGLTQIAAGTGTGTIAETLQNLTNGTLNATYVVTPQSADGCDGNTYVITVPVDPEPVGFNDVRTQCSDATLSYNLQALNINNTGSGGNNLLSQFTYTVSSNNGGVPAAADRVAPSIDPITDSYINDTGTDAIITYTVTPFGLIDGCQGNNFTVAFTYTSKPKGFDDTEVTCSDVPLNYNIQTQNIDDVTNGNSVPSDFTYTIISSSGSVSPKPNRTIKSDLPITDNYTNTSPVPVDITYTITPISKGTNCPGVPFDVVFTINPEPLGSDAAIDVCGGGTINFDLQGQISNTIASRFYYTVSSSSPGDVTADPDRPIGSASTAGISTSYNNTSPAPVIITYTVTPIANDGTNCEGNPFTVKFNIIPGPLGVNDNEEVCSGEQINYDIQTDNIDNGGNNIPGRFTYVVSSSNEAVVPTPIALDRTAASDLPITDTFNNTSAGDVTVTYTVTPISLTGGCVGPAFDVNFVIHPAPLGGDDLTGVLCSGDAISYNIQTDNIDNFNALPSEFTYVVTSSDQPNVPAAANRVVFSNADITDTYINTTSSAVNIDYTITPRETGPNNCVGSPFIVRFRIDPEPVLNPALDNTVCSQLSTDVVLSTNGTSVSATSYNIGNVTIDPSLTPLAGNVVFPQNGVNANYIRFDKYKNTTAGPLTVQYEVTPVSNMGCEGTMVVVEVTVLPEPVLDPALSPAPVCSGLPSNVTLGEDAGSVAAATYNIKGISVPGGLTAAAGNAIIGDGQLANAIFNDIYTNTTSVQLTVTYTITPVTAAGCEGESQTVLFAINPSPALANLNDIICSDAATGLTLATLPSSAPATDYEIMDIRPAAGLVVGGGNAGIGTTNNVNYLSADVFTNPTNGVLNVEYDIVPISGPGCRGPQVTAVITVEPEITVIAPGPETLCSGDATSIELRSNTIPSSGNITFDVFATASDPLVNGYTVFSQNLPNNAVAPFYTITDNIVNNSDVVQTVTYEITPRAFGANNGATCSAPTATLVTVTIMPKPKVTASQSFVTICEGQNLDIDLTTTTSIAPGTIEFEITGAVATGGVTGFSPVGTIFVNNDKLLDGLDNPTTSNQTVTYTITPRATGTAAGVCSGTPINIVVTVTPRPTVTPSVTDVRICSGEIVNISLPTDVANSIASWTVAPNANVLGQFDGLGNSLFQSLINTTTTQQVLTYTVEPFLLLDNSCTGNPVVITVTIDPVPDIVIADNQLSICSGETLNVLLDGNSANTTYDVVASSSNPDIIGYASFTATNGDFLNQTIVHNGTTPGTILYTITPRIEQPAPDVDPCKGLPQVIIVTVSPPVDAQIITDDETLCIGNTKAIEFAMQGSAPFKLTLEKTDVNGVVTTEVLDNLASRHVILTTESVSYRILEVEDFYSCIVNPVDEVNITFEFAEADFTINGSKTPAPVTLDFNTGTVDVTFALSNYNPANTYTLAIGDENVTVPGPNFTYTFNKPSDFGTLGYSVVLTVKTPNAFNCNDVENIFIEVLPAQPTVEAFADVLEGCPPLNVNFESFREDLSLSKNVVVENLVWDIDGQKIRTPNPTFTFTQSGTYNVIVTGDNGHGDEAFDNLVITVYPQPEAVFSITQTVVYIPDDGFRPTNRSKGATQFSWDFGDNSVPSTARSPEHFYEQEGEYIVTLNVSNDFGCVDTAIDTVTVEEGGFTKTPNAFTPNTNGPSGGAEFDPNVPGSGDSANDIFLPITQGITEFKMYIYDRWGNLIFFSDNKRVGWDGYNSKGQLLPSGVYIYKLDLILSNGQRTQRVGDVTLIR